MTCGPISALFFRQWFWFLQTGQAKTLKRCFLCHCEQCVPPQCVLFVAGCCVSLCDCALLSSLKAAIATLELSSTVELSEPQYQRCLKTRLCFMFRLKGFASICSETAPEVKSGDLQTLGKWRHAALMFHLSQPHNSNSTFMHLHWQSCMKYNPAVYIRCSGVVVAGVSKLPCVQQSAAERRGWQMGEQVVSDYGWIIIMSACWSRGGKMAEGLIGASLRQLSRQIDASACWDEDDML